MGDKLGENPAALRGAVFFLSAKNRRRGVFKHPPAGRRLTRALMGSGELRVLMGWWPVGKEPPPHIFKVLAVAEKFKGRWKDLVKVSNCTI